MRAAREKFEVGDRLRVLDCQYAEFNSMIGITLTLTRQGVFGVWGKSDYDGRWHYLLDSEVERIAANDWDDCLELA